MLWGVVKHVRRGAQSRLADASYGLVEDRFLEKLGMQKIRRSRFLFFSLGDEEILDIEAFLQGEVRFQKQCQLKALALLTAKSFLISEPDLQFISQLPAEHWVAVDEALHDRSMTQDRLEELVRVGVVLSDGDTEHEQALRRKENAVGENQWHPQAALYHLMLRSEEDNSAGRIVDVEALASSASDDADRFVAAHGPPPPEFHHLGREDRPNFKLPPGSRTGEFYKTLENRKTTRFFDTSKPFGIGEFSTLLHYTFGCQGTHHLSNDVLLLHKVSPSGGARHPIEAYPLVLQVEGLSPGFYHYNTYTHSLDLLQELELEDARNIAAKMGKGQQHLASAHAVVVLAARWLRTQWKYRKAQRSYGIILMDSGHLSQTFYLVAAHLGVSAFYTAAIDSEEIERQLGLEVLEEGAVGICCCGIGGESDSDIGFKPFFPGKTKI